MTWAYIAGFLDGDGWISASQNSNCTTKRYTVGFTQAATAARYIRQMQRFMSMHGIRVSFTRRYSITPSAPKPFPMVNLAVKEQASVVRLLTFLLPHLVIKKQKAQECFIYTKDRLAKRGYGVVLEKTDKRAWTKYEERQLTLLTKKRFGARAIAGRLGRSLHSVFQKRHKLRTR